MPKFRSLLRRFARDDGGAFAVIFGLMAIVLIAMGGAVVDYVFLEQARGRAQIALDAAALALQPDIGTLSESQLVARSQALVRERIADDRVTANVVSVNVDQTKGSLLFEATVSMPTLFVKLVGVNDLSARIFSGTAKGSLDVEVAVALDLSGSMSSYIESGNGGYQTKISALRAALNQLIDLVVQTDQTPTYSKMALAPYSVSVNAGTYANAVRGSIVQPTAITSITWANGSTKNITGATKANPAVITSNGHGFQNGDRVYISNISGMTQLNNRIYTVAGRTGNTFQLSGVSSSSYSNYSSNTGSVTKCLTYNCELLVTSPNHGLNTDDSAYISGVGGMNTYSPPSWPVASYNWYDNNPSTDNASYNWINNNTRDDDYRFLVWKIGTATQNTFILPGTSRTLGKNYGNYTSGGTVACVLQGCAYYLYLNRYSSYRRQPISTCVSERAVNAFTDVPPSTTLIGRNYPNSGNPCSLNPILPLTDNKTTLHTAANSLVAGGSTAGQVGIGWAWYLVSPNFNGPWPAASQPAGNDPVNPVVKAVVLMTDGEFNTVYCKGVIAQDSTTGSGDTNNHINCNGPNGDAIAQGLRLCQEIKDSGIIVYTVGFDIDTNPRAQQMMSECATDENKAFEANNGSELSSVFAEIGVNLSQLRITN